MRVVVRMLALLLLLPVACAMPSARADEPLKILLYGDSITHGSSGDYTWRYFLDRHLQTSGVAFDFVGPRSGLNHLADPADDWTDPDDQTYADPVFDTDAAAVWGQLFTWPVYDLADGTNGPGLVSQFTPDVVVGLIGLNDLGGFGGFKTPDDLRAVWREKILAAREADPGVDFVIVQVPDIWYANVTSYNQRLVALAAEMDSPADGSRVVTTALPPFDEAVDTWDGTHPTATGDLKIARAVEDALSAIGIGAPAGDQPSVVNGPVRPTRLSVTAGVEQATLTWLPVPGVTREWLESRDATLGAPWVRDPDPSPAGEVSRTVTGLVGGHRYEFRLRPAKGTAVAPVVTSTTVPVVPAMVPAPVVPLLDPVGHVRARSPRRDRVRTTAQPVPSATGYRLLVARAAKCRRAPRSAAFHAVGGDRRAPRAVTRTRSRALWVRWYAVRDGVPGRLGPASTTCVRVR